MTPRYTENLEYEDGHTIANDSRTPSTDSGNTDREGYDSYDDFPAFPTPTEDETPEPEG
jgi:hypothetical protein